MRVLVDIPDLQLKALDELGRERRVSRARVIREAVGEYLERQPSSASVAAAFGLWSTTGDGLDTQRALREEW
jgi:metal-responsive CopG/Arc/MetJ family transcriptional regulator